MIASAQKTDIEIFAFIDNPFLKLLSHKVLLIEKVLLIDNRNRNR